MAKVVSHDTGYESLVTAYGFAETTDTIYARAVTFVEGVAGSIVTLSSGKTIKLVGGLDAYYAPSGGFTMLQNVLKIRSGRLNVNGGLKIIP